MTQILIVTGKKKDRYEEKGWLDNYFHNVYKYGPKTKSRNGYTWSNKMADDVLKYCTKCNLVWEYVQYKEKQVNYELEKLYLDYSYKRDSIIIEYNK